MRFHRLLLVVNPVARTVSKPTLAVIEKALSADFQLEVAETKGKGHASELAAQAVANGIDLVVVFSGDGTINEVVNALAGTEVALGVLPGGATNVLVRALGLPTDPVECTGLLIARALDDGSTKLHLGRADGRYFAVNCGAGIDASAMRRLEKKFPSTKAKYDRVAFRAVAWELMVGYAGKKPDLEVAIDGGTEASLDSGLDVLSVRKLNRRNIPRIAWQVLGSARHVHGRDIDYFHDASQVVVTSSDPFPVQVDGDPLGDHRRLQIDIAREALWVVA
jgi:diacylglycerol kinase family enzyme